MESTTVVKKLALVTVFVGIILVAIVVPMSLEGWFNNETARFSIGLNGGDVNKLLSVCRACKVVGEIPEIKCSCGGGP